MLFPHTITRCFIAAAGLAFIPSTASAHVTLLSPNGGESYAAGSIVTIEWQLQIPHDQENWDLLYSTVSEPFEWIPIELDLPADNQNPGAFYSYEWTVPDIVAENAWIRVRQDNLSGEYDDISQMSFEIFDNSCLADLSGDGMLDFFDVSAFLTAYLENDLVADFNNDSTLDFFDVSEFLSAFADGCP